MADGYVILLYEGRDGHQVQHVGEDRDLLRYLQQSVHGHIEVVYPDYLHKPYLMVVNEEGLLLNMDINPAACWLYGSQDHAQPIVGPAVICKQVWDDDGPDIGLLSKEDVAEAMKDVWKAHGHYWSWDLNTDEHYGDPILGGDD